MTNNDNKTNIEMLMEMDDIISQIMIKNRDISVKVDGCILKSIIDFTEYIDYVAKIKENYLVVICSKDTPGNFLKNDLNILSCLDLSQNFQLSYVAIINEGKIIYEQLTSDRLDINDYISYNVTIDNCEISIVSKGYLIGNTSEIVINGNNYSRNIRGLNFVIYDKIEKKCLDSVGFDLHLADKSCYRDNKLGSSLSKMQLHKVTNIDNNLVKTINKKQQDLFFNLLKKENEDILDVKKSFFFSLPKSEELYNIQRGNHFILRIIDDICRKNDIGYWLIGGSLIGAIRHKNAIPWDDDVDISMTREDFFKFCDIIDNKENFPEIYLNRYCWDHDNELRGFCYRVEIGEAFSSGRKCFVDIFPCSYIDNIDDASKKIMQNIRNEFIKSKMGSLRNRWESVRKDMHAFNKQWREDVEEAENKFDAKLRISNNPEKLIFSMTNNCAGLLKFDVKDIFPLVETDYDSLKLFIPHYSWNYLNNYYGDIYYMPNDLKSRRHIKLDEKTIKTMNEFIQNKKLEMGWE